MLTGHGNQVVELAFSHDGDTLASASSDNTIKLWDVGRPQSARAAGRAIRGLFAGWQKLASAEW